MFRGPVLEKCQSETHKYFLWKIEKGWAKKNIPVTDEYLDRVNYEADVILRMGFVDYILIIADILEYAERISCPRSIGRGSASGSIVCYALDITRIDPIRYNLYFERFLNPDRVSNPDIDIDLGPSGRAKVFNHLVDLYGRDNVASIMTVGKMKARSIIRNIGMALKMETGPGSDIDKIAKLFPNMEIDFEDCLNNSEDLRKYKDRYPELFNVAQKLVGKPKSVGIHAAGTLITPCPVEELFPMGRGSGGKVNVTQWDMYDVEEAGFVKLDLLGLNTLDVIDRTIRLIKQRYNKDIDIFGIDMADQLTISLFRNGKTNGLFQLERKYVQEMCRKMDINSFDDICALNALIRPGSLHSGATKLYIDRKTGIEEYQCPHSSLKDALKDTYGILLYQETIMRAVRDYAGYTLAEADFLRKIIGKKQIEKFEAAKAEFYKRAEKLNRPGNVTDFIWSQIDAAKNYSFNASHSYSYGYVTFQAGWLKSHYFLEFMTELLNGEENSNEPKLDSYLRECRTNGVTILPPCVKHCNKFFQIENGKSIRFGLVFIKGVTERTVNALQENKEYLDSFTDLILHDGGELKRDSMVNLIMVGAFDYMNKNRKYLIDKYLFVKENVVNYKSQQKRKNDGVKIKKEYTIEQLKEWESSFTFDGNDYTMEEKIINEHELCDCYIVNDPLTPFSSLIEDESYRDIMDVKDGHFNKYEPVKIIAVVRTIKPHIITKGNSEGREMAFIDIFDSLSEMGAICFPDAWDAFKNDAFENAVYEFTGKYDGESLLVTNMSLMFDARKPESKQEKTTKKSNKKGEEECSTSSNVKNVG